MDERTLVILKPDAVRRRLVGEIVGRFEKKGLELKAVKMFRFDEALCRAHYAHLTDKDFFPLLLDYITSGPCVAMIWAGPDAVSKVRAMIGPTDSLRAAPGTIRGDYGLNGRENVIHASDSVTGAEEEIQRFFPGEMA